MANSRVSADFFENRRREGACEAPCALGKGVFERAWAETRPRAQACRRQACNIIMWFGLLVLAATLEIGGNGGADEPIITLKDPASHTIARIDTSGASAPVLLTLENYGCPLRI